MAAPTFVAKSTSTSQAGTGGVGATVNQPYVGSIQPNDKLIVIAIVEHAGAMIGSLTGPSGFASLGGSGFNNSSAAYAGNIGVYQKTADGTETGTVAVSCFSDVNMTLRAQMYQFRNVDGKVILVESTASKLDGNGSATITYNAVTVGGNERTLLALAAYVDSGPGTPAGYVSAATDTHFDCFTKENTNSDGLITTSGGGSGGWGTLHVSMFSPVGRSYIMILD